MLLKKNKSENNNGFMKDFIEVGFLRFLSVHPLEFELLGLNFMELLCKNTNNY